MIRIVMLKWLFISLLLLVPFISVAQNNHLQVDSIIKESVRYFSRNPEKSLDYLQQSLTLASEHKYENGIARSYHLIAQLLIKQGQQDSALFLLNESQKLYELIGDSSNIGKTLISQGDVFLQKRDYEMTLAKYTDARRILEKQSDPKALLTVLRRIGDFMWKTDENDEAMRYFNEALQLTKDLRDTAYLARIYLSLGNLHSKIKQYDRSQVYFDSALAYPKFVSVRQKSAIYNSLGILNYSTGRYQQSLNYHMKSQQFKEQLGDSVGLAATWLNLGNTLNKLNRNIAAEKTLQKSLRAAERLNLRYIIRTAYLNLSRINEENGDFQRALYFDNLYDSIDRKLFNEQKTRQLTEIRETLESEKKDAEIQILKKNEEIQEKESISRLQQRNFLIGATVLLIVIISLIYRAYRQKKQTNLILGEQNILIARREKEKELLLHEVNHRVKNNLQMVAGLLRLQSYNLADTKAAEAVKEGQARIEALTLIHKKIFEKGDHKKIIVSEYFQELVENLLLTDGQGVNSKIDLSPIELDIDQVVPLALIVNELITNSLKYAFNNQQERVIELSMDCNKYDKVILIVQDNGEHPVDIDKLQNAKSFGINLVYTLTSQLEGKISLDNATGTKWQLKFPLKN